MIEVQLPVFHPGQVAAYQMRDPVTGKRARYKALRAGRRWGKSQFLDAVTVDRAVKGKIVGWFTPETKFRAEPYADIARMLGPVMRRSSKTEGVMLTTTGGQVDYWSLENEMAGRGRRYHTVIVDEAAFAKENMLDLWKQNIEPTLLDFQGEAFVASNTNGVDPDQFFYAICNDPTLRFVQHHAPTSQNPYIPIAIPGESEIDFQLRRRKIFEDLIANTDPLVYQQEYLAEFVDWSGHAFFQLAKMLHPDPNNEASPGVPLDYPRFCDTVYATIDSATKTGKEHDGTAVCYCALTNGDPASLLILDWSLVQIEGSMLETWLPTVFENLEMLARKCRARFGSTGAYIEDKSSGMVLLQQAKNRGWPALPIDSKLTSLGKSERAISVSGYFYREQVKLHEVAYNKQMVYKGANRNHLLSQLLGFRVGQKDTPYTEDDLLDAVVYSAAVGLGNSEGF